MARQLRRWGNIKGCNEIKEETSSTGRKDTQHNTNVRKSQQVKHLAKRGGQRNIKAYCQGKNFPYFGGHIALALVPLSQTLYIAVRQRYKQSTYICVQDILFTIYIIKLCASWLTRRVFQNPSSFPSVTCILRPPISLVAPDALLFGSISNKWRRIFWNAGIPADPRPSDATNVDHGNRARTPKSSVPLDSNKRIPRQHVLNRHSQSDACAEPFTYSVHPSDPHSPVGFLSMHQALFSNDDESAKH
jgi:hypothetical protein